MNFDVNELKHITFKKSLFGGFRKNDVNSFLKEVAFDYEKYNAEYDHLLVEKQETTEIVEKQEKEISRLRVELIKLEHLKMLHLEKNEIEKTKKAAQNALVDAEKTAADILETAEKQAAKLIRRVKKQQRKIQKIEKSKIAKEYQNLRLSKEQLKKEVHQLNGIKISLVKTLEEYNKFQITVAKEYKQVIQHLEEKDQIETPVVLDNDEKISIKKIM